MSGRRREPLFIEAPEVEKPLRFRRPDRAGRFARREWEVVTVHNFVLLVGMLWAEVADPDGTDEDLDAISLATARMIPGARQTLLEDDGTTVELSTPMLLACSGWIVSLNLGRRGDAIWSGSPLLP